jgi:hypothetical protein
MALVFVLVAACIGFALTMVNVKTFATYYGFRGGQVTPNTDNDYYWELSLDDDVRFGAYEGKKNAVDTAKEWFLAMACGASQIRVTDVSMAARIEAVLPRNNPKARDLQAGAVVYQDIQINRFLGDTSAVGRHEAGLSFITGRGNATRAEIETYYRNGIRGLIAGIVDEEFNKIRFSMSNDTIRKGYNATLTRVANNQYILEYDGVYQGQNFYEKVPPAPLETLLATMRGDTVNFNQNCVNTVRAQAALIPAVALSDDALNEIKTILTNFYTTPNATTYACVKEARIVMSSALLSTRNVRYQEAAPAYERVLYALNEGLAQKVLADVRASSNISTLTRDQQQRLVGLR